MTKNKKSTKPAKKVKRRVRTQRGLTPYQGLLVDPCAGTLESPYSGERGVIQRFTADFTINNSAGLTSGYFMYSPAANTYFYNANASSTVAIAPITGVGVAGTFLGTSANKFRPISACLEVIPSAVSYNSMTGEIGAAVCATNQITTAGTYRVDDVFTLCQARSVLAKKNYSVNWFPGGLDHTYAVGVNNGSATLSDQADQNAVLIAYRGYPAGIALVIRITVVLEWTPVIGIGTAASSAPAAGVDFAKQVGGLHSMKPDWWHNFAASAMHGMGVLANYAARGAVRAGTNLLTQAVPRYLGGLAGPALLTL